MRYGKARCAKKISRYASIVVDELGPVHAVLADLKDGNLQAALGGRFLLPEGGRVRFDLISREFVG